MLVALILKNPLILQKLKTDMINITNECNMELMKRYEDNYFDLSIVDPEYGINVNKMGLGKGKKKQVHKKKEWDSKIPTKEYFKELKRVSKNQIIWGGNYFLDYLMNTRCVLIWDKIQEFSGSDFEMAWTSFDKCSKSFKMSRVEAYGRGTIHPTQKPVKLYEWQLMNYANKGNGLIEDLNGLRNFRVLDTHLGSGSIALACHNLGFNLTACELDTDYYNASLKRLKEHQQQLTMF